MVISVKSGVDDTTGFIDFPPTEFVTRYDPPPIPMRFFDWTAVSVDYEPGWPVGFGITEEDAITHLLDQIQEMAT